ncbi:uncharacterized protein LOC123311518 isoform X2 [Coccinella septempunctata]|uniref:uncharacterized protein LOC123311518 isoform X2 n=1 Tax=Coccinella septempunctata TaxID=41139 RepID=UPI001D088A06|nr:uncharacterized protein LOC123311518 isoform X2 [Coccinella septempunctata]
MSEGFSNNHSAKYSDGNAANYYQHIDTISESTEKLDHPYDHIYATNENSNIEIHKQKLNCQTAESEVRFLKQWLLLHLDLIQHQNEEILTKERTILILQQENEMLKERLNCMEQSVSLEDNKQEGVHSEEIQFKEIKLVEDMTQGLGSCNDIKDATLLEVNCNNVDSTSLDSEARQGQRNENSVTETQTFEVISNSLDCVSGSTDPCAELNFDSGIDANVKIESDTLDNLNSCVVYNFSSELDSMRHLRMSIRRKRVCSNSSAASQNGYCIEEKRTLKKLKKRRKKSIKDNQIIYTPDFYVNQIGDPVPGIPMSYETEPEGEVVDNAVLEVPRWRVKVYASCYTMEGTENLDDEVFLRRHNRLEIDERRRKRWDVQRIREQRVIEKLKQRHEKAEYQAKIEISNVTNTPLWPSLDDIKIIEVSQELPISSFGVPLPKVTENDFSITWLDGLDSNLSKDKVLLKRGSRRRKLKR